MRALVATLALALVPTALACTPSRTSTDAPVSELGEAILRVGRVERSVSTLITSLGPTDPASDELTHLRNSLTMLREDLALYEQIGGEPDAIRLAVDMVLESANAIPPLYPEGSDARRTAAITVAAVQLAMDEITRAI